jgi:transcriptional regulator with XRE-family HTH domain
MPGTIIKNHREYLNLSQQYVASQMGISQNAYSKIENNITQLTVLHVKKLSVIFKVPLTDLLKDEFQIVKTPQPQDYENVDREMVIRGIDKLQGMLKTNSVKTHQNYIAIFSLIQAAENIATAFV